MPSSHLRERPESTDDSVRTRARATARATASPDRASTDDRPTDRPTLGDALLPQDHRRLLGAEPPAEHEEPHVRFRVDLERRAHVDQTYATRRRLSPRDTRVDVEPSDHATDAPSMPMASPSSAHWSNIALTAALSTAGASGFRARALEPPDMRRRICAKGDDVMDEPPAAQPAGGEAQLSLAQVPRSAIPSYFLFMDAVPFTLKG